MGTKGKKLRFIKMKELRQMSEDELVELVVSRKYATKMEVYRMDRPDLLARIMRLQLDAGLQHEHRQEPNK
ncbi:MAG: hypothetical protein J6Y35_01755 [Bacteroidales bacterium]|nr:hypothetical protein [Bacteroidales bacterium]